MTLKLDQKNSNLKTVTESYYPFYNHYGFSTSWSYLDMFIKKKVPFLAKARHWCLRLHLDSSKFDLSSWVIPSVPMVKLKDCSFQFWRSHRKQTKHSGDIAIFFTVIFMIVVKHKCILQKWYSFTDYSN